MEKCLKKISSQYYTFSRQLGDFASSPHCPKKWTTTHDGHILHHSQIINDQDVHLIYVKPTRYSSRPQTRSGIIFQTSHSVLGTSDLPYHASVIQTGNNSIQLHSWTKIYAPPSNVPSFWDNIGAYGNESLWKNLRCDGDVSWIYDGMCTGSLVIIHGGSFMKEISPYISAAAVMIYCKTTKKGCKCTITEQSQSAGSYRGEILGGVVTQLILRAAVQGRMGPCPLTIEDCDNDGVVKHGNTPFRPLLSTQSNADILRIMKHMILDHPFHLKFLYVASHSDNNKRWKECSLKERINIKVDHLAKKALLATHASNQYFNGAFPLEDFQVHTDGRKLTGPTKTSLEEHWGRAKAKRFFDVKGIVWSSEFNAIWWAGLHRAIASYPQMFRIFISKQVSGWCGSNSKLSLWDSNVDNICPNCGIINETSKHMTRCTHDSRVTLFRESVEEVTECLEEANAEPVLITMIEEYLLAQGS